MSKEKMSVKENMHPNGHMKHAAHHVMLTGGVAQNDNVRRILNGLV